jgi:hypothetical protein
MNSIKGVAHINTAWNITNMVKVKITKPNTGCRKILSRNAVLLSPLSLFKITCLVICLTCSK